jgi:enoyl-[acyl-carrier-protein] reductase (NADH)
MAESIEVHQSIVREEMKGLSPREVYDRLVDQMIPLKRDQSPEDIGHLAAFLASDYARSITGQAINVCGGARMN